MLPNTSARATRRSSLFLIVLLAITMLIGSATAATAVGETRPLGADRPVAGSPARPALIGLPAVAPGLAADVAANTTDSGSGPARPIAPKTIPTLGQVVVARPTGSGETGGPRPAGSTAHRGRDHVWSSDLHLDRSVSAFPCTRSTPPAMAVYRWGCAGHNNVYLFAHAGGPFGGLHDLYVRGRLRQGMTVTYADGKGKVHRYRVAWWKVVLPTAGDFAYAALSRPSMTLQTCIGRRSEYRLVVRLYQDD